MDIKLMKSKIHAAIVTQAKLDYTGSITIDQDWMDAAGMIHGEKVLVVNNNNGARIETYTIRGKRGSKTICLNGAAARHFEVGDEIIIIAFGSFSHSEGSTEALVFEPKVIFPQEDGSCKTLEEVIIDKMNDMFAHENDFTISTHKDSLEELAMKMGQLPHYIEGLFTRNFL